MSKESYKFNTVKWKFNQKILKETYRWNICWSLFTLNSKIIFTNAKIYIYVVNNLLLKNGDILKLNFCLNINYIK